MDSDKDQISELLSRGVEEIIDLEHLNHRLELGDNLRVKMGIDPTSPDFHLGHLIPLLKLRDFQKLGHKIVLIIGDFTGLIGDSSDKESERPMLTEEKVKENAQTYIQQAGKIIDVDQTEILYNSKWLKGLDYIEIGRQADVFSLNEFISRENIDRRMKAGRRVSLRELIYPLMQGYDSVRVKADVEIGGTDQRFNLLAGRDIQRLYRQEPQDILTGPLLEGLDGRKMSASYGNTINLMDEPQDMFGKIMSLQDDLIIKYFILLTRVAISQIDDYKIELEKGANPRDLKLKLASEIVNLCYSESEAKQASDYFIETFSQKKMPSDIPALKPKDYALVSVLLESGMVSSKSEARRVVEQGGAKINGEVVKDLEYVIAPGSVLQKGKINFLKIE